MSNSTTETARQPIWRDRGARLSLGLAVILNLLLFVIVLLTRQQLNEADCVSAGGVYQGGNVPCNPDTCMPP